MLQISFLIIFNCQFFKGRKIIRIKPFDVLTQFLVLGQLFASFLTVSMVFCKRLVC